MKVLFLDNDGVICLGEQWGSRDKKIKNYIKKTGISDMKSMPVDIRLDNFDKKAVKVLNYVLKESGAEIVISSDWKLHASLEELKDLYLKQGIIKAPIAITPNLKDFDAHAAELFYWKGWYEKARILEITKFLNDNPAITHWAAIDDLYLGKNQKDDKGLENFILTRRPMTEGIKQSGIKEQLLKYLL